MAGRIRRQRAWRSRSNPRECRPRRRTEAQECGWWVWTQRFRVGGGSATRSEMVERSCLSLDDHDSKGGIRVENHNGGRVVGPGGGDLSDFDGLYGCKANWHQGKRDPHYLAE